MINLYAKSGTKVKAIYKDGKPFGGYDADENKVAKYCKEGVLYTIESIEAHNFSSTVELKEFPGQNFNTVLFVEVSKPEPTPLKQESAGEAKQIQDLCDISIQHCDKYLEKGIVEFNGFKQSLTTIKHLLAGQSGNTAGEWKDLQEQVKEHISGDNNFDWHEALTENEMTFLVDLLLTFRPKNYLPAQSGSGEEQRH